MSDPHDHSDEGDSPISSGSVVALAQRFVVKTLETSGNERLKKLGKGIKNAPELLGEKAGRMLAALLEAAGAGKPISEESKREFTKELETSPKEAAAILGFLTAELFDDAMDSTSERIALLEYYRSTLNLICLYMAKAKTSVALRGFLHDPHCISYWHFERSNLEFQTAVDSIFPNGLDVYFLEETPTDERLVELNMLIRDSKDRHLRTEDYDVWKKDTVAKLENISETIVTTKQLRKDRVSLPPPQTDPVFGRLRGTANSPIEYETRISPEPDALLTMVESLNVAKTALEYRRTKAIEGKRRLAETPPDKP